MSNSTQIGEVQPQPERIFTAQEFKDSLAVVKSAQKEKPVTGGEISDLSRLNEQEFFAAVVHRQLASKSRRTGEFFEERFSKLIGKFKEYDSKNCIFMAVRRILRLLGREQMISKAERLEIRKLSIGKCQLDQDRTRLSISRLTDESDNTPVRAVSTALRKFTENESASDEELASFRLQNKQELPRIRRS